MLAGSITFSLFVYTSLLISVFFFQLQKQYESNACARYFADTIFIKLYSWQLWGRNNSLVGQLMGLRSKFNRTKCRSPVISTHHAKTKLVIYSEMWIIFCTTHIFSLSRMAETTEHQLLISLQISHVDRRFRLLQTFPFTKSMQYCQWIFHFSYQLQTIASCIIR